MGHLHEALALQREYLKQWRSESFTAAYGDASDAVVAFMNIADRLGPLFHLIDNALSFEASPLLASPMRAHD